MKVKNRGFAGGSYTVEAAFIIPMILGILFAWLFQLFYLHDKVILNGMVKERMMVESSRWEDNGEETQKETDREKLQSHLWMLKIQEIEKQESVFRRIYHLRASTSWNLPVMRQFLGNHFEYKNKVEITALQPDSMLRMKTGAMTEEDKKEE